MAYSTVDKREIPKEERTITFHNTIAIDYSKCDNVFPLPLLLKNGRQIMHSICDLI